MKIKMTVLTVLLAFIMTALTSCSSGGDDEATLIINLGGTRSQSALTNWPQAMPIWINSTMR